MKLRWTILLPLLLSSPNAPGFLTAILSEKASGQWALGPWFFKGTHQEDCHNLALGIPRQCRKVLNHAHSLKITRGRRLFMGPIANDHLQGGK
jgi:hypothetical protein